MTIPDAHERIQTRFRQIGRILRHAFRESLSDQVAFVASGVAFRVTLATFPGIALLVWLGSQIFIAAEVHTVLDSASSAVPNSTRKVIEQAMNASLANGPAERSGGSSVLGPAAPSSGLHSRSGVPTAA